MINKSKAPITGKYYDLNFVSTAMGQINRGSDEKFYILITDLDPEPEILTGPIISKVEYITNNTVVFEKTMKVEKSLSPQHMDKHIKSFCAQVIIDTLASGLINYKMSSDALAENFAQKHFKNDRITLIKKIAASDPSHPAGLSRKWSFSDRAEGALNPIEDWDLRLLLDAPYEDLVKCYNELAEPKFNTDKLNDKFKELWESSKK